ncbi:6781_t:CDS:1, partial [Gigaspora rosea]
MKDFEGLYTNYSYIEDPFIDINNPPEINDSYVDSCTDDNGIEVNKTSESSQIRTRSFVWNYFKKEKGTSYARCDLCKPKKILIKCIDGSTSSLRKQLATKHVGKVPELDKEKKKLNVTVIDMLRNQQS